MNRLGRGVLLLACAGCLLAGIAMGRGQAHLAERALVAQQDALARCEADQQAAWSVAGLATRQSESLMTLIAGPSWRTRSERLVRSYVQFQDSAQ